MNTQNAPSCHSLLCDGYAPDFFSGALLGNGGLGCVVTTRPDSLLLHFGHNAVWDIRLEEFGREELGTFPDIFQRIRSLGKGTPIPDDPWLKEYFERAGKPYAAKYPRPFPCGSLLLAFDRRATTLTGHRLDLATGTCTVEFQHAGEPLFLEIEMDQLQDRLWLMGRDAGGRPSALPFVRVRLLPDPLASKSLPLLQEKICEDQQLLAFDQTLPASPVNEDGAWTRSPDDRFVSSVFHVASGIGSQCPEISTAVWYESGGGEPENNPLHRVFQSGTPFLGCLEIWHGLRDEKNPETFEVPDLAAHPDAISDSRKIWSDFWARSSVELDDELLERTWYRNLYFFHCAVRAGQVCPGLFANWSYLDIGTTWHGDWHLNYNTQQPFWLAFSSNHSEHHLPYVDMVDWIAPVAQWTAEEYFQLRGAYFPHLAYPVKMSVPAYMVPLWGWEICETPWTVQSLWWHFVYTRDFEFLGKRAFPHLRSASRFLADYLLRPEASGPQPEGLWDDDLLHIFPSVVPELYGLEPGFERNFDITIDLALTRFVFHATVEAINLLGVQEEELRADILKILPRLPEYPRAALEEGDVFINVQGEDPEVVQNLPASTAMVFPAEEISLNSSPEALETARRTWRNQNNEGGNDLIFLAMQGARLGILDLEAFKRQIRYCLLPNGTCADMVMQSRGRYHDTTARDWMAKSGIWFENFSLPAVINECLLQSVDGVIRLFPNWPLDNKAAFQNLRAVGAFLVSARCSGGAVESVSIRSEAGGDCVLINPWPGPAILNRDGHPGGILDGSRLQIPTAVNETLQLSAAQ